jgi:hypothetical protein
MAMQRGSTSIVIQFSPQIVRNFWNIKPQALPRWCLVLISNISTLAQIMALIECLNKKVNWWKSMRLLIPGCASHIDSHMAKYAQKSGYEASLKSIVC